MARSSGRKVAVSFTGGKDSTLVLHLIKLQASNQVASSAPGLRDAIPNDFCDLSGHDVACLVTFIPAGLTQPFKAHPLHVVKAQAEALGLPHRVCEVGEPYLESYQQHISKLSQDLGISLLATGDVEDVCSGFMRRAVQGTGVDLLTPLWHLPRSTILNLAWQMGLQPIISCTNLPKFRTSDPVLLATCQTATEQATAAQSQAEIVTAMQRGLSASATDGQQPYATHPVISLVNLTETQQPAATKKHDSPPVGVQFAQAAVSAGQRTSSDAPGLEPCAAVQAIPTGTTAAKAAMQGADGGMGDGSTVMGQWLVGSVLGPGLHERVLKPLGSQLGVDAGGEFGEYHTMVLDGALFRKAVKVHGDRRVEGEFCFLHVEAVELVEK